MLLEQFLSLGEVAQAEGNLQQEVTGLSYDSRKARPGDIFFAVSGEKLDGHDFVAQAFERGAAVAVVERMAACPTEMTAIRVKNVRRTMGLWSNHFYSRPSSRMHIVGVTGTNGKTTVTYLVESILEAAGMQPGVIGTVNYRHSGHEIPSHQTTPESPDLQALLAEMREGGVSSVAMEVSSHALAQERVRGVDFDIAVFTNLSRDHLDYHRDMDDYFSTKRRLFTDYLQSSTKRKKAAVIYGDDARGRELLGQLQGQGMELWSYGQSAHCDVRPLDVESDIGGLRGKVRVKDLSVEFSSRLIGAANLQNIMGALSVGFALGLPARSVVTGIERVTSVPGRLEKVDNDLGISILVDYAHTPDALEKVLQALRGLIAKADPRNPKLICVFGCGGDRDRGKRPLMGEVAARLSDVSVLTSDNPRTEDPLRILAEIEAGVQKTALNKFRAPGLGSRISELEPREVRLEAERGYCVEADRRTAIGIALSAARPGDLVLIAGKGHEDYQILGSKRIRFDDREVAREGLERVKGAFCETRNH